MKEKDILNTFLELVRIDSPSGEEGKVRKYLLKRMKRFDAKTDVDKRGNLFIRMKGVGKPLVLSAHMDTVEPGRGIKPVIEGRVVKSDGTTILGADNKVAIAAILHAIEEAGKEKRRSLEIVFSVREETDGGINEFNFNKLKGKTGIVADRSSGVGSIVLASPWIRNIKMKVLGKTAHSAMPEEGVNALTIAVNALAETNWGRLESGTTSNIGIIKGGTAMNSIPGEITLIGEVRSFSKETLDKYTERIKKVFSRQCKSMNGKLNFNETIYCSGYKYEKTDEAIKRVINAVRKEGLKVEFETSFGGSDANAFVANGIEMINIGDGSKNPHTVKEKVGIGSLVGLTRLICTYISSE